MVQAAQDRSGAHRPRLAPIRFRRIRDPLLQPLVRSGGVEVGHVLPQDAPQVRLAQLLGDPRIGGMPGHAQMHHPARGDLDHEEGIHLSEEQVGDREEVGGQMSLPWLARKVAHVCPERRGGRVPRM